MTRTITDIKQQCVSTYLGFPKLVNFGTAANNYNDADEVGQVINRTYHDVIEKALKMYPWSFCRRDGVIVGKKVKDQSYEHFSHYANIDEFLFDIVASSVTISQTTGSSLTDITIDVEKFELSLNKAIHGLDKESYTREDLENILKQGGNVVFTCAGVDLNGESVWEIIGSDETIVIDNIKDYGINWYFRDTPVVNDVLTVVYTAPSKNQNNKYVCMQAVFYDPKHWSKYFEWKQFDSNLIKFNLPKIYVEYTISVDADDYPAYFADYVACALAVEVCAPLRIESKLPILLQQLANIYLDARKQDSMGEPAPASFDNIIDEARNAL